MDIFNGVCVICSENTLVLSGKDKQKFIELLKEHYFDVNQINDNKFLLQFKEKRSEKSICLTCAYIINCYVNVRNKFVESKTKPETKCSICRIGSNLTNGTTELVNDALNILKNVNKNKKNPKLTLICLDCCFSIISWNKIKDIILQFAQSEEGMTKKRKISESDNSVTATNTFVVPKVPRRRSRARSVSVIRGKNDFYPLPAKLEHLSNVNHEIVSKDISLNNNITRKVMSDEKLLYHIPYITCETDDILLQNMTSTPKLTKRSFRSQSVMRSVVQTKISPPLKNIKRKQSEEPVSEKSKKIKKDLTDSKNKANSKKSNDKTDDNDETENNNESPKNVRKSRPKRRSSMYASVRDSSSYTNSDESFVPKKEKTTKTSKTSKTKDIKNDNNSENIRKSSRIKRKSICLDNSEIIISDSESDYSSLPRASSPPDVSFTPRVSVRANKGRNRYYQKVNKPAPTDRIRHKCSKCSKSFAKKYRTQLHELEHDVSFSPLVQLTREELIVRNDSEELADVDTLVKQVEIENKISEDSKLSDENEKEIIENEETDTQPATNETTNKETDTQPAANETNDEETDTQPAANETTNDEETDTQPAANETENITEEIENNKENDSTTDNDKQPEINTETNIEQTEGNQQEAEIISENGETQNCEQNEVIIENAKDSEEITNNDEKENNTNDASVIDINSSNNSDDDNIEIISDNICDEQEKNEVCIINEIDVETQKDNEIIKDNVNVEENGRNGISDTETNCETSQNINENEKTDLEIAEVINETQCVDLDRTNGSCNTRDVRTDKYEIVENLLQNLGA